MRIRYLRFPSELASSRLRQLIPAKILGERHEIVYDGPADVAVLQKFNWHDQAHLNARRVVFDICDDHFDHASYGYLYRKWVRDADLVTCNSKAMQERIRQFGVEATVIDDPYESEEKPAKCHEPVVWFGHQSNLVDLVPIIDKLPPLVVVSNHPGCEPWSPGVMQRVWSDCGLVVIPTGYRICKSANRAVESIRNGIYPCCGRLPAYEELGLGTDDVPLEVSDRLDNPGWTIQRIRELQDLVRERFSPETVAKAWEQSLSSTLDAATRKSTDGSTSTPPVARTSSTT